jgi:hypothetical protein
MEVSNELVEANSADASPELAAGSMRVSSNDWEYFIAHFLARKKGIMRVLLDLCQVSNSKEK